MPNRNARLYPLRFRPLYKRLVWGGRRLGTLLGKPIGPESDYAESWEVVDHGADQSIVADGPLAGTFLAELMAERGGELLGSCAPLPRFPLLFKFLDAHDWLSVQVHPNDAQAARQTPPDLGKTEAWVILHADPSSVLYAGLREGVDREAFALALARDQCVECLNRIEPRAGDCYFIPAGTLHALGPGLVVAEIQQASDTTYRLFDWNRVGPDGKGRALHIEAGLSVINDTRGPIFAQRPRATGRPHVERLVECEKFVLDRVRLGEQSEFGGDDGFHIVACLAGAARVASDAAERPLSAGGVILLPASVGAVNFLPIEPAVLLDMYLPPRH